MNPGNAVFRNKNLHSLSGFINLGDLSKLNPKPNAMTRYKALLTFVLLVPFIISAQTTDKTVKTALLIVDIQDFYFPGEGPGLFHAEDVQTAVLATLKDGRYAIVIDLKDFKENYKKYLFQPSE